MRIYVTSVLFSLFLIASGIAFSQVPNGILGYDQFPPFRGVSALAGSTYGTDKEGYVTLSGATAFSTPTAFVLGHDQVQMALSEMSHDGAPTFVESRGKNVAFATYGHTFGSFNVAVSDLIKSHFLDQSFNLQVEYITPKPEPWAVSVGVQDWRGGGGAAGDKEPGNTLSSRSFFGVVTYRFDTGHTPDVTVPEGAEDTVRRPLFVSLGIGTRRFFHPFGSASYQVVHPMRVWIEQDGFGVNEGVLFATKAGPGKRAPRLSLLLGYVKERYFVWGAGMGF